MASTTATVIAVAALTAVLFQALLTWSPNTVSGILPSSTSNGAGKLAEFSSSINIPTAHFTLTTLTHAAPTSTSAAQTSPTSAAHNTKLVPHESRGDVPNGWARKGAAHDSTKITMKIGLLSNAIDKLKEVLHKIATPGSSNFRQYLKASDVKQYMQPDPTSAKAVKSWLTKNGIHAKTSPGHGDWLTFSTTVGKANKLFNAKFETFHHADTGKKVVRSLSYSIPAHLKPHIAVAHPMVSFPNPYHGKTSRSSFTAPIPKRRSGSRMPLSRRDGDVSCGDAITPQCLQDIYGIPTAPANASGNSITVTGYGQQFAQDDDLEEFLQAFRPDMDDSTSFILQTTDGGQDTQSDKDGKAEDPDHDNGEANLDIQYTVGVATGVPVNFLSVGDNTTDGDLDGFLDTVNFMLTLDTLPTVMTTSYGPDEDLVSREMAYKLCDAIAAITVQGVSVLFATGDAGVGHNEGDCSAGEAFVAQFPSGCPYVTGVGATTGVPEMAANLSAGGFSNYFPRPDWQDDAVGGYLDFLGDTYSGLYNASGRAYPDVAAYGENVQIFDKGVQSPIAGTSCSSPIFASVIALLNDQLMSAGQPPLGFLNPWLYSNASSALNDMTEGFNPGCGTDGFPGTTGWDPVTGLGSPNFDSLLIAAGLTPPSD